MNLFGRLISVHFLDIIMDLTMSTMRRGEVLCYDARNAGSAPLWRLEAHGKECSVLAMNAAVPGLMLTGSTDKTLKVTRHFRPWACAES